MKGKGKGKDKKKKQYAVESKLPPLIPIESMLPPLVPIAGHMKHKAKKDEDEDEEIQRAIDNERIDDNLFSAPTFTSFLQKKYSSK
jgi:hypothetical protein